MKETQLEIKKLGINGEGIGYINRKITFVKGALPGEVVNVEVVEETTNFKEGKLISVVKPSASRVKSACFQQEHCLGCPLMILNDEQQLYFKRDIIRDSLTRYTSVDIRRIDFRKCLPATHKTEYRDTVHLPIVRFNRKVSFGIYQRDTKYLTLMNNCQMQHPLINRVLNDLEEIFESTEAKAYNEETRTGLRFLTARVIGKEVQLIFVTGRDRLDNAIIEEIEKLDYVTSIYYTINTNKGEDFDRGRYEKVSGKTRMDFTLFGQKFILSPKSEYPVNQSMIEPMINLVKSLLSKESKSILEVNCGIGYLGLSLDDSITVKGIDFSRHHVEDAKMNGRFLKKDNCSFEGGKIEELIVQLNKNKSFDAFIVHSNKKGMRKAVKDSLIKGRIKECIYISTSPSSFAKDVSDLEKYFVVETIVPMDYLPQSQNVLIVAKLKYRHDKKRF